ncbi:unnamed protein product [Prorocentrum cordatum]|uniref:Membrane transporter protein n=1 Tax=Prorocentrum cordatum TaxID=2364126 RepID=A0ABN9RIQ7_9DINO|nr:unnamed protein product [Polarella glacialis]
MVLPSLVSLATHCRLGNVRAGMALPLSLGSAAGALVGGSVATQAPEEPLQWLFSAVLVAIGSQKLWALRGRPGPRRGTACGAPRCAACGQRQGAGSAKAVTLLLEL